MRTVFLGTSEFAVAVLERLAASDHRPALVVTRPDAPRGRGRKLAPPPVAQAARALGIELFQPASINDEHGRARITEARPDAVCVCAYGALIKEPLLSEHWMINVHPSLLPRWRGAAPIERAIIAGDEQTGVSILEVSAKLDSGPVCGQRPVMISSADSYGTLAPRLASVGGEMLVSALDEHPTCEAQDEALATYAEKISTADRLLDGSRPAAQAERVVRALTPHIGAQVRLEDGALLGVLEARVAGHCAGARPGTISLDPPLPVLSCAEGSLELLTVKPAGRRAMRGEDFLRGRR